MGNSQHKSLKREYGLGKVRVIALLGTIRKELEDGYTLASIYRNRFNPEIISYRNFLKVAGQLLNPENDKEPMSKKPDLAASNYQENIVDFNAEISKLLNEPSSHQQEIPNQTIRPKPRLRPFDELI